MAETGDATAQYGLGMLYLTGKGALAPDYDEAANWLRQSAGAGNSDARNMIAVLYYHGMGIARNPQKAIELTLPAAESGDPVAQYNLGYFYWQGQGVARAVDAASAWISRAAQSGLPRAQYALGQMYRTGAIPPPDLELALSWYVAAAAQNHPAAKLMADEMIADGVRLPASHGRGDAPNQATAATTIPNPTASGKYLVWLGSMRSRQGAEELWRESRTLFPETLNDMSPSFAKVDLGEKGTFLRVFAGPGMSHEAASDICQQLHTRRPDVFCEARRG